MPGCQCASRVEHEQQRTRTAPTGARARDHRRARVGVSVHECTRPAGTWAALEAHDTYGLVFVRRGAFRRRGLDRDDYVGPATAFFDWLGEQEEVLHPHNGGDTTTIFTFFTFTQHARQRFAGARDLPRQPILTRGAIDLAHYRLVAGACRCMDAFEGEERFAELVGLLIEQPVPARLTAARPATHHAHRRMVENVKEVIALDPAGSDLPSLASVTGHSTFHLSRVFRQQTGLTLSQFRNRVRVVAAIELTEAGLMDLAAIAQQLGFSDQAHRTRVMRSELGAPPGHIQRLLTARVA